MLGQCQNANNDVLPSTPTSTKRWRNDLLLSGMFCLFLQKQKNKEGGLSCPLLLPVSTPIKYIYTQWGNLSNEPILLFKQLYVSDSRAISTDVPDLPLCCRAVLKETNKGKTSVSNYRELRLYFHKHLFK